MIECWLEIDREDQLNLQLGWALNLFTNLTILI